MPLGPVEVRFQQILTEIVTVSQEIRAHAIPHVNAQNCDLFESLHRRLEVIHISANAIVLALTKASITDYTIDDRLMDWLISGEMSSCLSKLKEMGDMMKHISQSRPAVASARFRRTTEDTLTAAMVFFDKHKDIFHFLLAPDIWNCETLPHPAAVSSTEEMRQDLRGSDITATKQRVGENYSSNLEQVAMVRRKKLDEALRWISGFNCTDKHNSMLKLRQEGTCKWFPNTDAYEKWRFGRDRFFWLQGKAGCGKSVFVASTIEHLKTTLRHEEVVVFFYFNFQNERSSTSTVMMRSLLSQLLCHFRDLGINPGDVPDKILDGKSKDNLSLDDLDQMLDLVLRAVNCFTWYPLIVIDALDECADIDVLLPALDKLKLDDVRLLVTSRPYEDMIDRFAWLQSLSFEDVAKDVAADIALHVIREIDSHKELRVADVKVKNEIRQQLNGKAEGRFRWVQCQLDALKQCASGAELKKALENLPSELETTYERILEKIDERRSQGQLARRTLVWLVVALNPLRLAQIVDGLLFDSEQGQIDYESQDLRTSLLSSLSSLVSYSEKTDALSLSHFSVKEYLTTGSRIASQTYYVVPHMAHADMVQMCMRYLSILLEQEKYTNDYVMLSKSFPMLSYVLCYGFDHMIHVQSSSIVVLKGLESLGADVRHRPTHWDRLCELREEELRWPYPPWPSSRHDLVLYILIAYSSSGLLQTFLFAHYPLKTRAGTNALVYAADLRKTEHAIVLLAYGAHVNEEGLMIDDPRKSFPIDVAIDLGNDTLVGEFLERGGMVTSEMISAVVCMPWYTVHVLAILMQTDQFANWAKEIGDKMLYRAVFNSARPCAGDSRKADEDHVALARRLREVGVDLSSDGQFGSELIERALHAAHTSMLEYLLPRDQPPPSRFLLATANGHTSETVAVVRFLLRRGVDINVVSDEFGDTPLHLAAMCPWEPRSLELIKEMINVGGDPLALNCHGETPLTIASNRGYPSVVEYILSCRTLPPSFLPIALQNRFAPRMLDLIIQQGANVKQTTSSGDTALHLAIYKYDESTSLTLLKKFFEAGCDPAACNSEGKTIMEAAIERGYWPALEQLLLWNVQLPLNIISTCLQHQTPPQLVEILICRGAIVKSIASNGDSTLHLAIYKYSQSTSLTLLKRFIEAGCDPTVRNFEGKAVVDAAIERGYLSVVKQLLSWNVQLPPNIIQTALQHRSTPQLIDILISRCVDMKFIVPNGDTVLHLAISNYSESTSLTLLKRLIEAGCDPTVRNFTGKTVVEAAIERGYMSVANQLLSCIVQLPPNIIQTALQHRSTPQFIGTLISRGVDVKSTVFNGDTALHLAVSNYNESTSLTLLKRFIEAGCDPTACNSKGKAVIEVAIECGHTSVVKQLLSCNVKLPPNIILSSLQSLSTLQMIDILIRGGADVESIAPNGDTVLHLVINKYNESTSLFLLKRFIEAGCDPTARNSKGETVMEAAIKHDYRSIVEHLLLCNVKLPRNIMPTCLRNRSTPQLVEILIARGADVKSIAPNGDSALHLVISKYNESTSLTLLKRLIGVGCDPAACNSEGKSVIEVAVKYGYRSAVELLLRLDVQLPPNIISTALEYQSTPQLVEILIHSGADVKSTAFNGDTVLHLVISKYDESTSLTLLRRFIEVGCDPTACNLEGKTVMMAAIEGGYGSVVEQLLLCNVRLPPNVIPTALEYQSTPQLIDILICRGADVRFIASNGDSALHLAIYKYNKSISLTLLKRFIEVGCDPTACNSQGKTVIEAAIERGYRSVVKQLLSFNVQLPPNIIPTSLQYLSTPRLVEILIRRGADVKFNAPNGDTALHLTISKYDESTSLTLLKMFIKAGCDPTARNSEGKTVVEVAIERRHQSVVKQLLLSNVPLPLSIVPTAVQNGAPLWMIELLIRNGASLHSTTSNGDTVLHIVIAKYAEPWCLYWVISFIGMGCNLMAHGSHAISILEAAMQRGYLSLTRHLLSCTDPRPPAFDILSKALQRHCIPPIVSLLVDHGASDLAVMSQSQWDALLGFAHTASYSEQDLALVLETLSPCYKGKGKMS